MLLLRMMHLLVLHRLLWVLTHIGCWRLLEMLALDGWSCRVHSCLCLAVVAIGMRRLWIVMLWVNRVTTCCCDGVLMGVQVLLLMSSRIAVQYGRR